MKTNVPNRLEFQNNTKPERTEPERHNRQGTKSCRLCGSDKHLMANCNSRLSANSTNQDKKMQVQCYKCKQFRHKANACNNTGSHTAAAMCLDNRLQQVTANKGDQWRTEGGARGPWPPPLWLTECYF
jgi:hypothetical protein